MIGVAHIDFVEMPEIGLDIRRAAGRRRKTFGRRTARLRGVLEAWADYRVVPGMAKGLAETASGSRREAYGRAQTQRRLAGMTGFRYLGEDDLSARPVAMHGEGVERIVHCALDMQHSRHVYRFRLTRDGRVVAFESEER